MDKQIYELNVDPELEAFMTPLSAEEAESLEESIVRNGCRTPLVVWNNTIVDGHHRYAICRRHGIPFGVEEQEFADKQEAMLWMYQEQTSHRNLGTVPRVVMALKCKPILLEKGKRRQGHRSDLDLLFKKTKSHNTRKLVAEMAGASESTVQKIEVIWEKADVDLRAGLLNGTISVNKAFRQVTQSAEQDKTARTQGDARIEAQEAHGEDREERRGGHRNPLAHFTDEQLEVELFRRQNVCASAEDAEEAMRRTIAPAPRRSNMEIPVWEGGVDTLYNAIVNAFCQDLWSMIEQTDKKYLQSATTGRLLDRLDELYDRAGGAMSEALRDKFGDDYRLPGFEE